MVSLSVFFKYAVIQFIIIATFILTIIGYILYVSTEVKLYFYIGNFLAILLVIEVVIISIFKHNRILTINEKEIVFIDNKKTEHFTLDEISEFKIVYSNYFGEFSPITFTLASGFGNIIKFRYLGKEVKFDVKLLNTDLQDLNKIFDTWRGVGFTYEIVNKWNKNISRLPAI